MAVNMATAKRALRKTTPVIGIRIPKWASFTREVNQGIIEFLQSASLKWRLDIDSESTNELPSVSIGSRWKGSGLITFRLTKKEQLAFRRRGIPVVNISSESSTNLGVHSVVPDNYQAGVLAARYLAELGMPNFAFWGNKKRNYSRSRQAGFVDELERMGKKCDVLDCDVYSLPFKERWTFLGREMRKVIRRLRKPVALFVKDDLAARTILQQCENLDVQVPEEMAILGFNDDIVFCHSSYPPLSSLAYPGRRIGFVAASILSRLMETDAVELPPITEVNIVSLIKRESTNTQGFEDEMVARAIKIIRDEAGSRSLKVFQIVKRLGVSRSLFQVKMNQAMGKTPKQLIDEAREQRLMAYLESTDLQIKEISFEMGFSSVEELCRFFKRSTGMSPGNYRSEQRNRSAR
jgi:LacI family transcriptional regulator